VPHSCRLELSGVPWLAATLLLAPAAPSHAQERGFDGTVCRANRGADRLIVVDETGRHPVVVSRSAQVTFEGRSYESSDLRPGDKVHLFGERRPSGVVEADDIDVRVRLGDALLDAILGTKPRLVGRFAVREAKTEYFSLNVPGDDYVRVDAKSAYGPKGRVWVSSLRSGDLLEISGTWTKDREIRASSIRVLTDDEPDSCRRKATKGETPQETAEREAAEHRFLDGYDDEDEEDDAEPESD
jgi:hypothetical protein